MAKEPASIPRELELPESKDYRFLKEKGIEVSQRLSGDIWTDYNVHDPGVTILEQLCLAITELAYKAGMNIEDILYAQRKVPFDSEDNAFFNPEKVFPAAPLSTIDYRRLIIDQMYPDVRNAWLGPLESGAFGVNMSGLYQVSLILNEDIDEEAEEVREKVHRLLNKNRNLSEDFETIRILEPLYLSLKGEIAVNPAYLVENVMGEVLYKLSLAITPPVRYKTRAELEEEGQTVDQIFDGPLPKHGFVDKESLKESGNSPFWQVIQPSRLVNILREIEGIDAVRDLEIGIYIEDHTLPTGFSLIEKFKGEEEHDGYYVSTFIEKLPRGHRIKDIKRPRRDLVEDFYPIREEEDIPDGFFPQLDAQSILRQRMFRCTVEGLEYDYEIKSVDKTLQRFQTEHLVQYQHPIVYPPHKPRSRRTAKEMTYYYSIQYHFPEIYGVGPYGVGRNRPLEWRTHATNLKGYLFFFEQIMADYLTQLTEFYQLFSLKEQVGQTYFHQIPQIPNQHLVIRENQELDDLEYSVRQISSTFDPVGDRRNRALDHLLARFGEEFLGESYNALTRNTIEDNQVKFEQEMIKAKIKFLNNIGELTRDRGRGQDYLGFGGGKAAQDAVLHSNALQKRLALLFNMKDYMQMSLSESIRGAKGVEFRKGQTKSRESEGKMAFSFSAANQDILAQVLHDGLSRENFAIAENSEKEGEFQVYFGPTAGFAGGGEPVLVAKSYDKCEAAVTALIRRLRELNAASEGFHMIEHVLLRPVGSVMHTFYLVQEGRVFLETPVMERDDFETEFVEALSRRGFDSDNYVVTGSMDEGYTLVLTEEDGSIIAFKDGYIDEYSAERERDKIILLLPQLEDPDPSVQIRKEQYIPKGALLADDFYSLQISTVLPSWPLRFRNEKFRALFEQVLKLTVPAHASIDCYWIDLAEMADFEKIYNEWRNEKAKLKPKQPWLDELSWCMVILLKYFQDPNDELVEKELPVLRDKHGLSMRFAQYGE